MTKIWVTKYALTEGIEVRDAEIGDHSIAKWRGKYNDNYLHGEGREWHRTPESAEAKAEQMRLAKIRSHHKAIAKLEKMSIKAPR